MGGRPRRGSSSSSQIVARDGHQSLLRVPLNFRWIQEGFKGGFLQKHLNPIRGPFLGDSVRILGCISDFWSVTPTFGLYL